MTNRVRVGVLFGGRSGEHEVSLQSAASVLAALDPERFEAVPIGITKDGEWLLPDDAHLALERGVTAGHGTHLALRPSSGGEGVAAFIAAGRSAAAQPTVAQPAAAQARAARPTPPLDVVFPVLHGPYGEDGTVQGMLELAGIPYVGSGVLASAVAMDKAMQKALFQQAGIPVADYELVRSADWRLDRAGVEGRLEARFGFPLFVKPANYGSSVGISKVHARDELRSALELAARYDRRLVVEAFVAGRELECSVLGNDEPRASLPGEVLSGREFYDYDAKYRDDRSRTVIPAELADDVIAEVQRLAIRSFEVLDGSGFARVDFFLQEDDGEHGRRLLVNEVNTIPGFTRISMFAKLWEASGLSYRDLLTRLIELAFERHRERAKLGDANGRRDLSEG